MALDGRRRTFVSKFVPVNLIPSFIPSCHLRSNSDPLQIWFTCRNVCALFSSPTFFAPRQSVHNQVFASQMCTSEHFWNDYISQLTGWRGFGWASLCSCLLICFPRLKEVIFHTRESRWLHYCCWPAVGPEQASETYQGKEREEKEKRKGEKKNLTQFTTEPLLAGWPAYFHDAHSLPTAQSQLARRVHRRLWRLDCKFSTQANCLNESGMCENVFIRILGYAFAIGSDTNATISEGVMTICIHHLGNSPSCYVL